MKNTLTYLFLAFMLAFMSCSKDGEIGPKGDKGEQGPQGAQGIPGTDGSRILSGVTVPGNSDGTNGDFYIDLSKGLLYGPKTQAGWGEPFSMKGDDGDNGKDGTDGANGKDGTKILAGEGTPNISLGALGDFYFDQSNGLLYGPKAANTWGAAVSLRSSGEGGAKAIILKNIQILNPVNGQNEYLNTQPSFLYTSTINLPDLNLKRGITYYYWHFVSPIENTPLDIDTDNFTELSWIEANKGILLNYLDRAGGNVFEFQLGISPSNNLPNPNSTQLRFVLNGRANTLAGGSAYIGDLVNFINDTKFNILIQHIPYSTVEIMKTQGVNIDDPSQVKRFMKIN